jgi:hypothetical protein
MDLTYTYRPMVQVLVEIYKIYNFIINTVNIFFITTKNKQVSLKIFLFTNISFSLDPNYIPSPYGVSCLFGGHWECKQEIL